MLELGMPWTPVSLPTSLVTKEVTLVPSLLYGHRHDEREFAESAALLAALPGVGSAVIGRRFALDDAADAFAAAADRAGGAGKVVLHPVASDLPGV